MTEQKFLLFKYIYLSLIYHLTNDLVSAYKAT